MHQVNLEKLSFQVEIEEYLELLFHYHFVYALKAILTVFLFPIIHSHLLYWSFIISGISSVLCSSNVLNIFIHSIDQYLGL